MGFTGKKKSPFKIMDNGGGGGGYVDSETNRKWFIAGIGIRSPLKPIFTKPVEKDLDDDQEECCTTPTSDESRIPSRLSCPPPPPKKRKSSSRCHFSGAREFFNPPDLETVFIRRAGKA